MAEFFDYFTDLDDDEIVPEPEMTREERFVDALQYALEDAAARRGWKFEKTTHYCNLIGEDTYQFYLNPHKCDHVIVRKVDVSKPFNLRDHSIDKIMDPSKCEPETYLIKINIRDGMNLDQVVHVCHNIATEILEYLPELNTLSR